MKRIFILALIALGCAVKQEVKWPEPGFTGASQDPLETYTFDSTLAFETLTSAEIAVLDSARLAYFNVIRDSFPEMGIPWWASSMRSWLHHTYDSLTVIDKRASSYYVHLCNLHHAVFYKWLVGIQALNHMPMCVLDSLVRLRVNLSDSLALSQAAFGTSPVPTYEYDIDIPKPSSAHY